MDVFPHLVLSCFGFFFSCGKSACVSVFQCLLFLFDAPMGHMIPLAMPCSTSRYGRLLF